jgi:penicillin-binding protein 1A
MSKEKSRSDIRKNRVRREKRGFFKTLVLWSFLLAIFFVICSAAAGVAIYYSISKDLPKITSLSDYHPSIITSVYSDDNRKIAEFFKERRIVMPLSQMPSMLVDAFVAAEDARFYKHQGIDLISIVRAFFKNLEAGTIVQGGSTITQQVTKSFLLTPERSYKRKLREAILAYRIDKKISKEDVLYLYLNQIYLGHGAYGVQAASENYFGKSVKNLNLAECSMLAGLPQAPSRYSPFRHPERAKQRQIYVLNRMVEEGYIDNIQATEAINTQLDIKPRRNLYIEEIPFYTEHVRRYIENKYGTDALYTQGLQVYTAVNIEMQKIARQEIQKGLFELDKRSGFRGPLQHIKPEEIESFSQTLQAELAKKPLSEGAVTKAVVIAVNDAKKKVTVRMGMSQGVIALKDMQWARKPNLELAYFEAKIRKPSEALAVGDVILVRIKREKTEDENTWAVDLEQIPVAQSALMSIEAETGLVKAMVGGRDFKQTQFNRAIQSRRQPGSAFKPIIYAAALDKQFDDPEKIYTPATVIVDSAIVFKDEERDFTWKPKNYKKTFYGPTLFRKALTKSRNLVTIKILQDIGVDYAIDYASKMGIDSKLSRDLSIALGSSGISLLELLRAYSVFANQGYLVEPVFVLKVTDRHGKILEEMAPERKKVIEQSTAYIMTNLLEGVVKHGTGWRVRELKRPVAGKTGTTNNLFDALFVGYTPQFITGVWVGLDEEAPLGKGETGSRAASPIWLGFMQGVLENEPAKVFQAPEGIVFAKIDADTGLLPVPESKDVIFECFKEGTVPTKYTKRPNEVREVEDLFKKDI